MEIVSFEIAKKLKEKGFREKCLAYYTSEHTLYNNTICLTEDKYLCLSDIDYEEFLKSNNEETRWENICDAPTISQVLKWLRVERKIYVEPCILADADTDADGKVINEYTYWSFSVTHIETGDGIYFEYERIDDKRFESYELAAIAGIEYCLDNLI